MTDPGPHLLGRTPSPPDERDFRLSQFMTGDDNLLSRALAELKKTTTGYQYYVTKGADPPKSSHWFKALTLLGQTGVFWWPGVRDVSWTVSKQLDQGQTNHCVGFGWAGWSVAEPYQNVTYGDTAAHDIYYEIKVIEGEPGQENGAWVRSGAKAMQARKRLGAYAFADTIEEIQTYLHTKGPVVVGTDWTDDMFAPDAAGYVKPTGAVAGGHCYLLMGELLGEDAFLFQNSWGAGWGQNGRFKMKTADFAQVFANQGEAVASLELAL